MPEITILSEEEIPFYPAPGVTQVRVAVTYTWADGPPRTVWIDKEEYSDEVLRKAIRQDMERARAEAPRTLTI